jgi:hypothetical protein
MTPPITAMTIIAAPNSTAVVRKRFPGSHCFKREVRGGRLQGVRPVTRSWRPAMTRAGSRSPGCRGSQSVIFALPGPGRYIEDVA